MRALNNTLLLRLRRFRCIKAAENPVTTETRTTLRRCPADATTRRPAIAGDRGGEKCGLGRNGNDRIGLRQNAENSIGAVVQAQNSKLDLI
jgi:hypothetical protein